MKIVLAVLSLLVSVSAQAEVRNQIFRVNSLKAENGILEVSYRTGGGCAKHEVKFEAEVIVTQSGTFNSADIQINVFDTSPTEDMCEAIISVSGSVDIKKLVNEALEAKGLLGKANPYEVILPRLSIR